MRLRRALVPILLTSLLTACGGRETAAPAAHDDGRPSLLLVTLDTTRADAMGWETDRVETPALAALAARGARFAQAYATAPETLPSHASMLTGLYPAGHGVHENARPLAASHPTVAERLRDAGWATAAFVSGYPLERQFGLARGFERYDDGFGEGLAERSAKATTDLAVAWLEASGKGPAFVWVHYYDPHEPYAPPSPWRERHADDPYLGEVAAMDAELARLVDAFDRRSGGEGRIVVVGDHGESLGEHGERLHGNLLYQGVARVPLVVVGPEETAGSVRDEPVSTRRVADTLLEWGGLGTATPRGLGHVVDEPALGEAMRPFLQYGWQPQVMAVEGDLKAIRAGESIEVYDVRRDPGETTDLAGSTELPRGLRAALRDYPMPTDFDAESPEQALSAEAKARLASLGYLAAGAPPKLRADAPRPAEMTHLFEALDRGSGLFVAGDYAAAIPVFEKVQAEDPGNFTVALRLAVASSVLNRDADADRWFARAESLDPESLDLAHYRAMHLASRGEIERAEPLFERVLARMPDRLPALRELARIREQQGRVDEAVALFERYAALAKDPAEELQHLGRLAMTQGDTATAVSALERSRAMAPEAFRGYLELGVLYLSESRFEEARDALDRVDPRHPAHAMALFKRAQVAVLLGEPDRDERVRAAWRGGDATTRPLIRAERLFQGVELR